MILPNRLIALTFLAAICSLFLAFSYWAETGSPPEKVVKAFLKKMRVNDYDGAKEYATEGTQEVLQTLKYLAIPLNKKNPKIKKVICEVKADTAWCKACCNEDGARRDITAVKVNEEWKVLMTKSEMQKSENPDTGDGDRRRYYHKTAEGTAKIFYNSLNRGDYATAKAYSTDDMATVLEAFGSAAGSNTKGKRDSSKVELSKIICEEAGDRAICTVCCNARGEVQLKLLKEPKGWAVSMTKEESQENIPLTLPNPNQGDDKEELERSIKRKPGKTPEQTAKNFINALNKGDYEQAKKYGTENMVYFLNMIKASSAVDGDNSTIIKITDVSCEMNGDNGVCTVCCNGNGESSPVKLRKVDKGWLVDMQKEESENLPTVSPIPLKDKTKKKQVDKGYQRKKSKTPEKAVKAFLESMYKNDYQNAKKYSTLETGEALDIARQLHDPSSDKEKEPLTGLEIDCEIIGDSADCTCSAKSGMVGNNSIKATKEAKGWYVSMGKEEMQKESPEIEGEDEH